MLQSDAEEFAKANPGASLAESSDTRPPSLCPTIVIVENRLSARSCCAHAAGWSRSGSPTWPAGSAAAPPSADLAALASADELIVPIQCEYYALEGLGQLLRTVDMVKAIGDDKKPEEATTLDELISMFKQQGHKKIVEADESG